MAPVMHLWYDEEGDVLEITFHDAKGYFKEIAEDVYERIDSEGNLLGYMVMNVTQHGRQNMAIPFEAWRLQALAQD